MLNFANKNIYLVFMLCDHPVIQISPNSTARQELHYVIPHEPSPNAEPA
jgi:hypothetical protein